MKKIFWTLLILAVFSAQTVFAASNSAKLPTRWSSWVESVNYNVFTWKSNSKVALLDKYASYRVEAIKTVVAENSADLTKQYADQYQNFKTKQFNLIKNKNLNQETIQTAANNTIAQQKELSVLRQASNENIKKVIASVQEAVANDQKKILEQKTGEEKAGEFADQTVAAWRDPQNQTKGEEAATRIYASGTSASGRDGVIIDGGEGKIVEGSNGELKIEYAPGTGPNSVTNTQGKAVWTIVQSDGSVVTSYQAAGPVVIGGTVGVAGNVIVGSGGQSISGSAQQVTGGSGGTGEQKIEGGTGSGEQGKVIQGGSGGTGGQKVEVQP